MQPKPISDRAEPADARTLARKERFLGKCLKPDEISGPDRDRRIAELLNWFDRYIDGNANPKWFQAHAYEMIYTVAALSALPAPARESETNPWTPLEKWLRGIADRLEELAESRTVEWPPDLLAWAGHARFYANRIGTAPPQQEPVAWQPIETAPRDGRYVLLAAPSGYTTTPLRVEVCRYDAEYRPLQPWVNHANDSFTDGGELPTLWMPLPHHETGNRETY